MSPSLTTELKTNPDDSGNNVKLKDNALADESLKIKFNQVWPELVAEISNDPEFEDMPLALDWLNRVMEKNVTQGKQNRALAFINVYYKLVQDEVIRGRNEKLCMIAGWAIEITQAAALMADDIMDESETRRGVKCWYKESNVGMSAVNDAFLLENLGHFISYKYFGDEPYFRRLLSHNHNMIMKTVMGQCMDTRLALEDLNMDNFTLETYRRIVTYKTSYYSFYSPVATAMIMAEITDDSIYDTVRSVTLQMGFLFQVQDDYLDCFGDPNVTGKIGTDISDGKCTWLIVKALEFASGDQRRILESCYGKKTEKDVKTVQGIYNDLDIQDHYRAFERETYADTLELINALPDCLPKPSFQRTLNTIFKRRK